MEDIYGGDKDKIEYSFDMVIYAWSLMVLGLNVNVIPNIRKEHRI